MILMTEEEFEEQIRKNEKEFHSFLEECKSQNNEIDESVKVRIKETVKEYFNRMSTLKE